MTVDFMASGLDLPFRSVRENTSLRCKPYGAANLSTCCSFVTTQPLWHANPTQQPSGIHNDTQTHPVCRKIKLEAGRANYTVI